MSKASEIDQLRARIPTWPRFRSVQKTFASPGKADRWDIAAAIDDDAIAALGFALAGHARDASALSEAEQLHLAKRLGLGKLHPTTAALLARCPFVLHQCFDDMDTNTVSSSWIDPELHKAQATEIATAFVQAWDELGVPSRCWRSNENGGTQIDHPPLPPDLVSPHLPRAWNRVVAIVHARAEQLLGRTIPKQTTLPPSSKINKAAKPPVFLDDGNHVRYPDARGALWRIGRSSKPGKSPRRPLDLHDPENKTLPVVPTPQCDYALVRPLLEKFIADIEAEDAKRATDKKAVRIHHAHAQRPPADPTASVSEDVDYVLRYFPDWKLPTSDRSLRDTVTAIDLVLSGWEDLRIVAVLEALPGSRSRADLHRNYATRNVLPSAHRLAQEKLAEMFAEQEKKEEESIQEAARQAEDDHARASSMGRYAQAPEGDVLRQGAGVVRIASEDFPKRKAVRQGLLDASNGDVISPFDPRHSGFDYTKYTDRVAWCGMLNHAKISTGAVRAAAVVCPDESLYGFGSNACAEYTCPTCGPSRGARMVFGLGGEDGVWTRSQQAQSGLACVQIVTEDRSWPAIRDARDAILKLLPEGDRDKVTRFHGCGMGLLVAFKLSTFEPLAGLVDGVSRNGVTLHGGNVLVIEDAIELVARVMHTRDVHFWELMQELPEAHAAGRRPALWDSGWVRGTQIARARSPLSPPLPDLNDPALGAATAEDAVSDELAAERRAELIELGIWNAKQTHCNCGKQHKLAYFGYRGSPEKLDPAAVYGPEGGFPHAPTLDQLIRFHPEAVPLGV